MYFIVNISRPPREITISDLNFTLGPNKAIDLEKVRTRSQIEDSKDLKKAVKTRFVEIRHSSKQFAPEPVQQANTNQKVEVGDEQIAQIRAAIKAEMQQHLSNQPQTAAPTDNSALLPELLAAIKELKNIASQNGATPQQAQLLRDIQVEDDDISEEKLAAMHAKVVKNKLLKETDGNISFEQTNSKGSLVDKAKELGDLLDA